MIRALFSLLKISVFGLYCLASASCTPGNRSPEIPVANRVKPVLVVHTGISADGYPSPAWMEAIRERHDEYELAEIQSARNPITPEEQRWTNLIKSRTDDWTGWIDSLSIPFLNIAPPDTVHIILGNNGGEDAFTSSDSTIGFDLRKLLMIYGSASKAENLDRINRFFSHEMTHILHKAWDKKHGTTSNSPLEYALWDCLAEGLGNYRSLSSKWVSDKGELTARAREVLDKLQPVFVERLLALKNADDEQAPKLLEGLSSGPFTQKWGALTCALWLAMEAEGDDKKLQPWVRAGPHGIIKLALKHLPPDLRKKFSSIE